MKNVKETVGIDVSKLTLDVFIHTLKDHAQFENNRRGYLKILKWLKSKQINLNEVLECSYPKGGIFSTKFHSEN